VLVQHVHGLAGLGRGCRDQVLTVDHGGQDQDNERGQNRGEQQISERSLNGPGEPPGYRLERHLRILCKHRRGRMIKFALQKRSSDQVSAA
jgi:hypothetical protein